MNHLYYGDNLDILRRFIKDESVDLIYLDPPFNSKRDYNAVFTGKGGQKAAAQVQAFEDTWRWDESAARAYEEVVVKGTHTGLAEYLKSLRTMIGTSDRLAYLSMMSVRMLELRRVLKSTGSIYLHCDPAMSHYLKLMMDCLFSPHCFRSEIIWKRTSSHNSAKRWGPIHDTLLFYTKSKSTYTWNRVLLPLSLEHVGNNYKYEDEMGRYSAPDLTGAGRSEGESGMPWRGVNPSLHGRHWAIPKELIEIAIRKSGATTDPQQLNTQEKLDLLDATGLIRWPEKGAVPRGKKYLSDAGQPIQDIILDIAPLSDNDAERLGYPTQKPESLLERIVQASSNKGDVILDPFCGCGTAITVAQRLERGWIGIDVTHLAVNLMRSRLIDAFGKAVNGTFKVYGEPTTLEDAEALAEHDKYQFQFWSLGLVGARPEASDEKKGADKGIDGKRFFSDELKGSTKTIIISVKGGKSIPANSVRDLRGTIEREGAEIGVLISIAEPTKSMREDAAAAGFYASPMGTKHPRLQLLTVRQLLDGKTIDMPSGNQTRGDVQTIKKARKTTSHDDQSLSLQL